MPALLYGIGVLSLFSGLVMIGFGIPINEFSFGNTLISAGTTAAVGGLVIIGLGVVAGQVRRLAEAFSGQLPGRLSEPIETPDATVAARPNRAPLPPKTMSEAHLGEVIPVPGAGAVPFENQLTESTAPTLRNPDESPLAVENDVSLSPRHPLSQTTASGSDHPAGGMRSSSVGPALGGAGASANERNREPAAGWRSVPPPATSSPAQTRPLHTANFDAMWPAEAKLPKTEAQSEARGDSSSRDAVAKRGEAEGQKSRAPAILKSGVVDGMAYTLYVDGSIEAELPQGTLRFASINELRSHLAKNS